MLYHTVSNVNEIRSDHGSPIQFLVAAQSVRSSVFQIFKVVSLAGLALCADTSKIKLTELGPGAPWPRVWS